VNVKLAVRKVTARLYKVNVVQNVHMSSYTSGSSQRSTAQRMGRAEAVILRPGYGGFACQQQNPNAATTVQKNKHSHLHGYVRMR
jgi:NAD/NADP transhydrogenase beta subunit